MPEYPRYTPNVGSQFKHALKVTDEGICNTFVMEVELHLNSVSCSLPARDNASQNCFVYSGSDLQWKIVVDVEVKAGVLTESAIEMNDAISKFSPIAGDVLLSSKLFCPILSNDTFRI